MFTYFHLAADRKLTEALANTGSICVAYETLSDDHGRLPLLTPMSEVAGRMSIQEGAKYLERRKWDAAFSWPACLGSSRPRDHPRRRRGGGQRGQDRAGFRAKVSLFDVNMDRLRYLDDVMPPKRHRPL